MEKKKMLVLGASGLTGYKVMQLAKSRFDVQGTYNARSTSYDLLLKLDLSKPDELNKLMHEVKPDVVVNTTALHNVDYCESHPEEAYHINAAMVKEMAEHCDNIGARFVHISTDFVFDGRKGAPYTESDPPNPESVYAKSKLEGETFARTCQSWCVIRTSVVYGWTPLETQGSTSSSGKPMNFALWALSKLARAEELKIVRDQFTSPTLADVLAAVIVKVAGTAVGKNELYHVAGTSCTSRYEFTRKLASMMGYRADAVQPVESKLFAQVAKRPALSCLDCSKVQSALGYRLLNVDESLAVMRSQIEMESPNLLGS
ncbi:dTDP-4-dehydrorhamnose reductase [Nitrososphaera sp.]|uniref:dTDP-4-dehydrorhamnose reductase n=1 Tax=Nitrososphaera sp. TaxID=1971748 RepID=UPI00307E31C6